MTVDSLDVFNDAVLISLPLIILVALMCCAYPDRYIGTKSRPDLPGPRGLPLIGNLLQMFPHRKRMLHHVHEMEQQYGELFTFTTPGWGRSIFINRPEWLEHVRKRKLCASSHQRK